MPPTIPAALMWFRRDLRLDDNAALYHALRSSAAVHAAFVFDTDILDPLPREDRRVEFIRDAVSALDRDLRDAGGGLVVRHARARDAIPRLAHELGVRAVFANHDDEPAGLARDAAVRDALAGMGIAFHTFKDQTIFERQEVLTQAGKPYSVYTPYRKAWLGKIDAFYLRAYPVRRHVGALAHSSLEGVPTLCAIGFRPTNLRALGFEASADGGAALLRDFLTRIDAYGATRDLPWLNATSLLGVHLRFGTVSIRQLAREAHGRANDGRDGAQTWLDELVWRDFFFQVLANFPHVADASGKGGNFHRAFDAVQWEAGAHADALFSAWCEGRTGYPIVDAAMAQIRATGFMHNRLRMVVASFLCKDLGIDWRRGERWFAEQLNDYELASNNGNWQWAASTGCDAQPWFRIFNPVNQSRKFDPDGRFIREWLPQLADLATGALHAPWTASASELAAAGVVLGVTYPHPIVDHDEARRQALARYGVVKDAKQRN